MTRPLGQLSALLFDADPERARCRRYRRPLRSWVCPANASGDDLRTVIDELDALARAGAEIVLSLSYEAYRAFSVADGLAPVAVRPGEPPLLQAVQFAECDLITAEQALAWLAETAGAAEAQFVPVQPAIDEATFVRAVEEVRDQIAAGRTYQANLTFSADCALLGWADPSASPSAADRLLAAGFAQLAAQSEVGYGALLLFPESSLLSLSPELFFSLEGRRLTTRPMKGTLATGDTDRQTTDAAASLAADPKNRAENLMIVDLLRNDLARLPQARQVAVSEPFAVARHGSVLQMTTTVAAELDAQPSLWELLDALFPCGSVTGAPKRETIRILRDLEAGPRGAYCGAIGYLSGGSGGLTATMSVPIRTLEAPAKPTVDGLGVLRWPLRLGLGAGITYPSVAADEWFECLLKGQFVDRVARRFEVFETIRLVRVADGWAAPSADAHRVRLASSATALGLVPPLERSRPRNSQTPPKIRGHLSDSRARTGDGRAGTTDGLRPSAFEAALAEGLTEAARFATPGENVLGLRLARGDDGRFRTALRHLEPLETVRFAVHPQPRHSSDPTLAHKTTLRSSYDRAIAEARREGLFDYVFCNERGELTEGARSCLLVRLDGVWRTPPLPRGLLPSLTRAAALADPDLDVIEAVLSPSDLLRAEAILLGNSLYGLLPAQFVR